MLDKKEQTKKLNDAVDAFLSLDAYQIPEFCTQLAKAGIFLNVSIQPQFSYEASVAMQAPDVAPIT